MKELNFWVMVSMGRYDGGEVEAKVQLNDDEYELLKKCCREESQIDECEGLEDLYNRICDEAFSEAQSGIEEYGEESDLEIPYESYSFSINIPEKLEELVAIESELFINDDGLVVARLTRGSDSFDGDNYIWYGTDPLSLKEFVKDIVLEDGTVEDALSNNPDFDHGKGAAKYIRDYFSEENNSWESIVDFDYEDLDCSIYLSILTHQDILDVLEDYCDEYISVNDVNDADEVDPDMVVYDPDNIEQIISLVDDIYSNQL